jgi:hypothetical protein
MRGVVIRVLAPMDHHAASLPATVRINLNVEPGVIIRFAIGPIPTLAMMAPWEHANLTRFWVRSKLRLILARTRVASLPIPGRLRVST